MFSSYFFDFLQMLILFKGIVRESLRCLIFSYRSGTVLFLLLLPGLLWLLFVVFFFSHLALKSFITIHEIGVKIHQLSDLPTWMVANFGKRSLYFPYPHDFDDMSLRRSLSLFLSTYQGAAIVLPRIMFFLTLLISIFVSTAFLLASYVYVRIAKIIDLIRVILWCKLSPLLLPIKG